VRRRKNAGSEGIAVQLRGSRAGNEVQSKAHRYLGKVLQKLTRRKKHGLLLGVVLVLAGVDDELHELTAIARVNHNTWNIKAENRLKIQASFKRMQVRMNRKEGAAACDCCRGEGGEGGGTRSRPCRHHPRPSSPLPAGCWGAAAGREDGGALVPCPVSSAR
jgi:hypothetical protein